MQVSLQQLEQFLSEIREAKDCILTAIVPTKISKTIFGGTVLKHLTVRCVLNPLMDPACRALIHQYYINNGIVTWAIDAYNNGPNWRQYCYEGSKVVCQHIRTGTKYLECYLPFDHEIHTMYSCNGEELDRKAVERVLPAKTRDNTTPVILRYTLTNVVEVIFDGMNWEIGGK